MIPGDDLNVDGDNLSDKNQQKSNDSHEHPIVCELEGRLFVLMVIISPVPIALSNLHQPREFQDGQT